MRRRSVVQLRAPLRQALESGTMWSCNTGLVVGRGRRGGTHDIDVASEGVRVSSELGAWRVSEGGRAREGGNGPRRTRFRK